MSNEVATIILEKDIIVDYPWSEINEVCVKAVLHRVQTFYEL